MGPWQIPQRGAVHPYCVKVNGNGESVHPKTRLLPPAFGECHDPDEQQ
jgi:hypothetical protein